MNEDRHSVADPHELITDPDEKARREAENGVRQAYVVTDIVREYIRDPERAFTLSARHILQLHQAALEGIHPLAGTYRNTSVSIGKSKHDPPDHFLVPDLVQEMCDYINDTWISASPIHLAAYSVWRVCWIHPFADGNGRTARAIMYMLLNIKLNSVLAGSPTIPDQIASNKSPYYEALELADESWEAGKLDVSVMEELLESMLAKQLLSAVAQAGGKTE